MHGKHDIGGCNSQNVLFPITWFDAMEVSRIHEIHEMAQWEIDLRIVRWSRVCKDFMS